MSNETPEMALPKRIVVTCPGCEIPLELSVVGWELGKAIDTDQDKGIGLNLAAWAKHDCGGKS